MIKTNIKMRVTPEQSRKVQEICFKNGIYWNALTKKDVIDTRGTFLYIEDTITHDVVDINNVNEAREFEQYFQKYVLQEVDADLFIRTNGTCIEKKSCKTENEDLKLPNEFKVRVNSEESQKLQEVLFEDGFSWNGNKEVRYLDCNYIYSSNKRLFLLDDEHYFNKCTYREITVGLILSFYPEKEKISDVHNSHYKKQVIDTITRSKANMTLDQQKAICIFQIDRYTHREKGQNLSDIKKIRDYLDWLEEIEIKLKDKE